jgi:phospholipid/cholesterol/gamma-HCH transport system permease protein
MPPRASRSQADSPPDIGAITVQEDAGVLTVVMTGRWNVYTVMAHEDVIIGLRRRSAHETRIDISGVTLLDTVAAIAVSRIERWMTQSGTVSIVGAREDQRALLDQIATVDSRPEAVPPKRTWIGRVANLGKITVGLGHEARNLVGFFGELSVVFYRLVIHPGRFRLTSTVSHMQAVGLNAMPIVGLLAFLVGVVLTFISGDQLQRFGAGIFIVNLVGIGVLRELGLMITAIIVAGRSGSAFTAEIGTMKINQEVDAMRTIGLDPMEVLVVPRTLALIVMLVPLGFFADMIMISGGMLMSKLTLDITFAEFLHQFRSAVSLSQLWIGMLKAPFFAFVIAMVGCFHGLQVAGSAESVGQHTTASVVQSIFLVITLDALFAVIFSHVGW